MLFLHEYGYSFFTLPKLTISEINILIDAYIRKQKKKEKQMKKSSSKNKRKR